MDRARRDRPALPALLDGPDGAYPGGPGAERRPRAEQHRAAVDLDIYGFLLAGLLITMGTLGDRIGRRRLLLIGAAAFGAASVLAAFSTSAEMLSIAGRPGGRRHPGALDPVADPQHVPRRPPADVRDRSMGHELLVGGAIGPSPALLELFWWGRCSCWPSRSWRCCWQSARASCRSSATPARAARPPERCQSLVAVLAVIYGVKRIAEDGGRPPRVDPRRLAVGRLHQARAGRPPRRPRALPGAGLQRRARDDTWPCWSVRRLLPDRPVPPARPRPLAASAGLWTLPSAAASSSARCLPPIVRRAPTWWSPAAWRSPPRFALLTQVEGASGLPIVVGGSVLLALGAAPG